MFVGPRSLGPWQNEEMRAAIDQRVRDSARRFRVIPVLLPGAERGERSSLPTLLTATTWAEFRDSLDDANAFHRLVCGIRGVEPGPGPGKVIFEGQCPYRGLRAFDVDDAPFFFGREALVQWLLNAVRPATESQPVNRFLAVVGASGSGKSSVARAGLLAAIKHGAIPGSSRWPMAILRPGPDPVESLAVALSRAVNVGQGAPALAELIAEFLKNDKTLHLVARQSLICSPTVTRKCVRHATGGRCGPIRGSFYALSQGGLARGAHSQPSLRRQGRPGSNSGHSNHARRLLPQVCGKRRAGGGIFRSPRSGRTDDGRRTASGH